MIQAINGGKDSGAASNGLYEKDITLKLAQKVNKKLADYEVQTHLTRADDNYVTLSGRAQFANKYKADFFLSIHVNSSVSPNAGGFESFIHPNASQDSTEKQKLIHYEVAKVFRNYDLADRGTKKANFAVLRETAMPAVLIECGFINNKRENELLRQDSFLDSVACGIVAGLVRAFSLVRKVIAQPTVIIGGREYTGAMENGVLVAKLPIREVFQSVGCGVLWEDETMKCYIKKGEQE